MTLREKARDTLAYVAPVVLGLLVTFVGLAPWVVMVRLNARIHPEVPWAALATLAWLALYIAWLNGVGPPARWRAARRYRLRLWRPGANGWSKAGIGVTLSLMAFIGLLTLMWILIGAPEQQPDLGSYPTTVYLVSIVIMTPLVAAVTEEAGYRGYM